MFLIFLAIDFLIMLTLILCLYSRSGSVPEISQIIVDILDYNDPFNLAIASISIASILILTFALIGLLIFKDYSWQAYSEKKFLFQIESLIIVLLRGPLLMPIVLLILKSYFSFADIQDVLYMKYLSIICSILSTCILTVYSYMGSYLFNLSIPNE